MQESNLRLRRHTDRGTHRAPQAFGVPKTPVGIEPTSTGLQPVAWPSSSSVVTKKDRFFLDPVILVRDRTNTEIPMRLENVLQNGAETVQYISDDADLQKVREAWSNLSEAERAAVMKIVRRANGCGT